MLKIHFKVSTTRALQRYEIDCFTNKVLVESWSSQSAYLIKYAGSQCCHFNLFTTCFSV